MEFPRSFGAAAAILKESIKLVPENGKLFSLVIALTLVPSSLFFMVFNFSYKSLLRDMLAKESFVPITSFNSSEFSNFLADLKIDYRLLLLIQAAFVLSYFIISLFSTTATILVSAMSFNCKTLSPKDFISVVVRSWKRPFVTGLYTTILVAGYLFFALFGTSHVLAFSASSMVAFFSMVIFLWIAAYIGYLYLSVVWDLALVISVIEENCFGIEALGKAGGLSKGNMNHGFIVNAIFTLLSLILFQGFRIIRGHNWLVNPTIFGLLLVNFSFLLKMFYLVAYAVFYFQCKKNHGEELEFELELEGAVEYTKLSTPTLVNDIP